jgi:N-acetylmuramoyl-L-alanine amidase
MNQGNGLRTALALALVLGFATRSGAGLSLAGKVIVVDAGHATIDFKRAIINSGKSRDTMSEHRLNMDIARYLGELLEADGATVYLTRSPADYWRMSYSAIEDNKSRAYFANEVKADALLAIHCDWHPSRKFYGVTTFYLDPKARPLAETVQKGLVRHLQTRDRGVIRNNFTILENAEVPAILVECGFMSNRTEGRKLLQTAYQKKIAAGLASSLRRYFAG